MKDEREALKGTWSVLNTIWFVSFFSVVVYAFLGLLLKGYVGFSFGEDTLNRLRTFFYLLTLLTITFAVYRRNRVVGRARNAKRREDRLLLYRRAVIESAGIMDVVGVYGFLLLLFGDRFYGFPLMITAGLGMLYLRPKRSELQELL